MFIKKRVVCVVLFVVGVYIFVGCGGLGVELGINDLFICEVLNVFNLIGMVCELLLFI